MALQPILPLAGSAARTASGNGDTLDLIGLSGYSGLLPPQLRVQCDVTVVSGTTPSLTVVIEDSIDGSTWNTIATFTAQSTVSRLVITAGIRGDAYPAGFAWPFNARRVRARWTISGTTPSFTFSVSANLL